MSLTLLPFSRLPGEVLMDSRLKPQHIRVLIALYMHANKRSEVVWPKRKTLARLTGIREATISGLTSELEAFGWVTKANNSGGCNRPASYRMHVPDDLDSGLDVRLTDDGDLVCPTPETALDLSTVPELGTVPKSGTRTVPKSGTRTVPKSGTGKEQTNEQTIEQTIGVGASAPPRPAKSAQKAPAPKPASLAKPDGVDDQVWDDFLQVRKAKRSPLTATALAGIEREAAKAGIGLQQALEVCCESGWVGFKADWYANQRLVNATAQGRSQVGRKQSQSFAEKDYGTGIQVL